MRWTASDPADRLATVEQNTDRLDTLIGNLLDMSRPNASSLEPFLRPTAIDEVAPLALRGLDGASRLTMAVPEGMPLVRADPDLLERVLVNLFANAVQHSPLTSSPVLRAGHRGAVVVPEVIDHGRGVSDDAKQRIFEPFARLDNRRPGVGLGLAVAKGFTETMGGTIVAVDTPGGGLTVRVMLSLAGSEARPAMDMAP